MKAYNVILVTKDPRSAERVKQTIRSLGKWVEEESGVIGVTHMKVMPSNQDSTCSTICNLIREEINVFEDKVMVSRISPDYVSYINWGEGDKLIGEDNEGGKETRNFERFDNRHEALLAFELEKPRWVYDNGVSMTIHMDLDEWCWLPVKQDGIYERSKYQKYILV